MTFGKAVKSNVLQTSRFTHNISNDVFIINNIINRKLKEKRNNNDNCTKYEGTKFNGISKDEKPTIPIKSYKAKYQVHTIQNGMGDIFYIPNPRNEANYWYLLTGKAIFTMI